MAKIILTQEVSGLGAAGDVVTVKDAPLVRLVLRLLWKRLRQLLRPWLLSRLSLHTRLALTAACSVPSRLTLLLRLLRLPALAPLTSAPSTWVPLSSAPVSTR